ncbi:MAG: HEAT repeat domain-containing protein [bacterium]
MTKKNKIRITLAVILLMAGGFLWTFNWNPLVPVGFLTTLPANKEQKETYANRKYKKVKKQVASCLNPKIASIKTAKNIVDSDGYKKMWGYIDKIERAANALKAMQSAYDVLGNANPDAAVETMQFFVGKFNDDILALPKEADFAMIDAMCDPSIEWETKYWLSQWLGDRNGKEALPLFREIAQSEDEPFLLRISVIDQIGRLEDKEASNLLVGLLDNPDSILRSKGSSTLRDITDQGDEHIYEILSSHLYSEKDETVRGCLLGSMFMIGGDKALPEAKEILKTATGDEKITVAFLLADIHSDDSFEMLKDMYDPRDESSFSVVISSLAKLEMKEANEFLYGIIEEANGLNSVMAAEYLKDQKQKGAIPYIEKALEKETKEEFIGDYKEILAQLNQ